MEIRKLSDDEILELLYEQKALLKGLQVQRIKNNEYDYILEGLITGNDESIDNILNKMEG